MKCLDLVMFHGNFISTFATMDEIMIFDNLHDNFISNYYYWNFLKQTKQKSMYVINWRFEKFSHLSTCLTIKWFEFILTTMSYTLFPLKGKNHFSKLANLILINLTEIDWKVHFSWNSYIWTTWLHRLNCQVQFITEKRLKMLS